jgi:hypothetical protein
MECIKNTFSRADTENPDCSSDVHFKYFTEENKLLVVRNKEFGYYICAEVSKLEIGLRLQTIGQVVWLLISETQRKHHSCT